MIEPGYPRRKSKVKMPTAKRLKDGDVIVYISDGPGMGATTKIRARVEGADYYRKPAGESFIMIKAREISKEIIYKKPRTR